MAAPFRSLAFSTSDSSAKLNAWVGADPQNFAKLQTWIDKHNPGVSVFMALHGSGSDAEQLRLNAMADPSLGIK